MIYEVFIARESCIFMKKNRLNVIFFNSINEE